MFYRIKAFAAFAAFAAALSLFVYCGCATRQGKVMVVPSNIHTFKVYESEEKPGHNQWPTAFLNSSGELCVVFQNIFGNLKQKPGYDYREHPENYKITRIGMKYSEQTGKFIKIWQKQEEKSVCWIMAPHPALSGKVIGMRESFKNNSGCIEIVETKDSGRTFSVISSVSLPGANLYPNDIRCIGGKIYLAAYDGNGGVYISESCDEGKSWSKPFKFAESHDNMSFHEPAIAELSNGNIMAVLRTHRMDIPKHNGINYHTVVLSRCGDGLWKASEPHDTGFGFRGRPYLLRTRSGVLVLACPNHFMAFSMNDGKNWESGLYDFQIQEVEIYSDGVKKPYSHNAETTLIELPDGRLYYSYFIGSDFPFPPPCDEYIGGIFFSLERK